MSVDGIGRKGGPDGAGGPKGTGRKGGPKSPPPGGNSKGPVSPKKPNLFMKNFLKAIRAEPEVRTDVVEKYKDQIKAGEYKINPNKLASQLLMESIEESFKS